MPRGASRLSDNCYLLPRGWQFRDAATDAYRTTPDEWESVSSTDLVIDWPPSPRPQPSGSHRNYCDYRDIRGLVEHSERTAAAAAHAPADVIQKASACTRESKAVAETRPRSGLSLAEYSTIILYDREWMLLKSSRSTEQRRFGNELRISVFT